MKRLDFCLVAAVLVFSAVASCKGDPTADLRGGPSSLDLTPNLMFIDDGDTKAFKVTVRDQQLNPVPGSVTVTSTDQAVATVVPDTDASSADGATYSFIVSALRTGSARLAVSGGGLSDTATLVVVPVVFPGVPVGSTVVGDTFRVAITEPLFSFDADDANIEFGEGVMAEVLSVTAETLTVRVPQPDGGQPAPVIVHGVGLNYRPGVSVPVPTDTALDVTPIGDRETPGAVVITPPASGGPDLVFYDGFKSGANGTTLFIDYFYQFTLAATDTLTFTLDWDTEADLDMINFRTNFTVIGGGGAATGANPETYTVIFPAGTYYLLIESFDDGDDPAHLFKVTIHNP